MDDVRRRIPRPAINASPLSRGTLLSLPGWLALLAVDRYLGHISLPNATPAAATGPDQWWEAELGSFHVDAIFYPRL